MRTNETEAMDQWRAARQTLDRAFQSLRSDNRAVTRQLLLQAFEELDTLRIFIETGYW